jgi:aerobic carbon-monoxide dehydrogenase small subunit
LGGLILVIELTNETHEAETEIQLTVNGTTARCSVEPRMTLLDCLRDKLHLHGTHVGCEHGVCGCCNVIVDGVLVRSCLMLAAQADGLPVRTIEGIEGPDGEMSDLQQAFCDAHALQCGYCTPGMIMAIEDALSRGDPPADGDLEEAISSTLCRCTGYQQIREAARRVARVRAAGGGGANHDSGPLEPAGPARTGS